MNLNFLSIKISIQQLCIEAKKMNGIVFAKCVRKLFQRFILRKTMFKKNPKYGWEQMYLSLCLKCSKDFILLRNIDSVWNDFIARILTQNVENVEIPIGDKRITFTATHLAEIQTTLQLGEEWK